MMQLIRKYFLTSGQKLVGDFPSYLTAKEKEEIQKIEGKKGTERDEGWR